MKKGFFITFEGVEGTGKSTQAALLGKALHQAGHRVVQTREPGGTRLGVELRKILLGVGYSEISPSAELFLYMADRAQHMAEVVSPALEERMIVVCDRFTDATVAYQGFGRGISRERIHLLNDEATSHRRPDLTVLLEVKDVAEGLRRAVERNLREGLEGREDRFEKEQLEFHLRVQTGYRFLAASDPSRFRVISSEGPVEEVHRKIRAAVEEALAGLGAGEGGQDGAV